MRTNRISLVELKKYVEKSMLIDSSSSATQIIREATKCGLLSQKPVGYFVTGRGRKLGKFQKEVSYQISDRAKGLLIQEVYLNVDAGQACCSDFLKSFRVDTVLGTFVFDRREDESPDETRWLRTLSRTGLLAVDTKCAKVNTKYLDVVNKCLRRIRDGLSGEEQTLVTTEKR